MKVAIVNCFDTFMDREASLRRFFIERGDDVTAIVSDFLHVEKKTRTNTLEGYTLVHAKPYQKNLSVKRMASHACYARTVANTLEQGCWDLIWVIAPPNSLIAQCGKYRKRHPETKLVIDINDLWPESFPIEKIKWMPPFAVWRGLRNRYLPIADAIVTECGLFQRRLGLPDDKCTTIYLCKQEKQSECPVKTLDLDGISLCYLGSINHIIDIQAISETIKSIAQVSAVTIHVVGDGENRGLLLSCAEEAGAKVVYHGVVYDEAEKLRILSQCHFGLNMMRSSVCVGLTMKSMDYFAAGLPLINNIAGDTWDLINQYGFGLNWSPNAQIDWNRFDVISAGRKARAFFERELTYEQFVRRVESVLEKL